MDKFIVTGSAGFDEFVTGMSGSALIVANKFMPAT